MEILILISLYILVFLINYLPEVSPLGRKERILYCITLFSSFIVNLLYTLDVSVPGPTGIIEALVMKMLQVFQ